MAKDANTVKIVTLLADAAKLDTVYRDVHLRRARQLFSAVLDEASYRAIGAAEKEIEDLMRRSRSAVMQRNWAEAADLSAQIDSTRQRVAKTGNLAAMAKELYDAEPMVFDPFSPGKHLSAAGQGVQAGLRAQAMDVFASLAKLDGAASAFYEKRRSYFSGLEIQAGAAAKAGASRDRSQIEKQAMEAAERGDSAALQRLAQELRDWKESEAAPAAGAPMVMSARFECPVDLSAPLPPQAIERARELGLAEARTAPLAELAKVREVIYAYVDQPMPSNPELEREGVLRARAMAENELPAQLDAEEPRVLAGQFIQQVFLNSGGARYLPPLSTETVLVEDFAESEAAANAPSKLLDALGLKQRGGLPRTSIEAALLRASPQILEERLGLDPLEFRLVCIPYDLYTRFGRERGFGQWHHWTHFDGYQFMGGTRVRALAGGDGRFGGLLDLVSISPSDAREGVYARFAVVRRARQVLRWK